MAEDTIKEKEIVFGRWADSLEESAVNFRFLERVPVFIITYGFGEEAVERLRVLFATTFDPHSSKMQFRFVVFDLRGLKVLHPSGMEFLRNLRNRLKNMEGNLFLAANTRLMEEEDRLLLESEFSVAPSLEGAISRAKEARHRTTVAAQVRS